MSNALTTSAALRLADLTPGATFQIQLNDPARPGATVWTDVTITADAPVEADGGVELVACCSAAGRVYRRPVSAFQRCP